MKLSGAPASCLGALFLRFAIGRSRVVLSNEIAAIPLLRVKVYNDNEMPPLLIAALFNNKTACCCKAMPVHWFSVLVAASSEDDKPNARVDYA